MRRAGRTQVKRLERSGLSQLQAEELTAHICAVVAGTLERLEAKFATKTEAERVRAWSCRHLP